LIGWQRNATKDETPFARLLRYLWRSMESIEQTAHCILAIIAH